MPKGKKGIMKGKKSRPNGTKSKRHQPPSDDEESEEESEEEEVCFVLLKLIRVD